MDTNILETDSKIKAHLSTPQNSPSPELSPHLSPLDFTTWFIQHLSVRPLISDNYSFYLIETLDFLQRYELELKKPIQITFHKKCASPHELEMAEITRRYFYALSQLTCLSRVSSGLQTWVRQTMESRECGCPRPDLTLEENDFFICCQTCGERFELGNIAMNYGDSKRLILSQKNPHDKKHHFSECIDKFQGIQKYEFPPTFFADMERHLCAYELLDSVAVPRHIRFARVTKDHIKLILKNMGLYKQYKEDINVIYKILTEKPLPQINHLKNRLLDDFILFDEKYNQLFSKVEKSAYHYYLILYQLLCSYGIACNKADFNFLKTAERKSQHDTKYKRVFENLGWNYTPLF